MHQLHRGGVPIFFTIQVIHFEKNGTILVLYYVIWNFVIYDDI